jgi:hypothetical protein
MPKKRKGSGLAKIRKKTTKKEQIPPSPPPEELTVPGDACDDEQDESLPVEDFLIDNDNTRSILQATSDECSTLSAQATRLALAYQYLNVLGAPPPEDWDGRDGTVRFLREALKIPVAVSGKSFPRYITATAWVPNTLERGMWRESLAERS